MLLLLFRVINSPGNFNPLLSAPRDAYISPCLTYHAEFEEILLKKKEKRKIDSLDSIHK